MELKIEIPPFTKEKGIDYKWENNFVIEASIVNGTIVIKANREGLTSLANHLLNLAQENVPPGHHLHFDEFNSLEESSAELIIEKMQ